MKKKMSKPRNKDCAAMFANPKGGVHKNKAEKRLTNKKEQIIVNDFQSLDECCAWLETILSLNDILTLSKEMVKMALLKDLGIDDKVDKSYPLPLKKGLKAVVLGREDVEVEELYPSLTEMVNLHRNF